MNTRQALCFLAFGSLVLPSFALADAIFAVDNTTISGLQGVLKLDPTTLGIQSSFTTSNPILGIAASDDNNVFLTDGGAIYHYSAGGTLLNSLSGLVADRFEDVSYSNGFVYAVTTPRSQVCRVS